MINTIADLLEELEKRGIEQITPFHKVKHPTLIGDMYEGLTKSLLQKMVFKGLDLRIVSGKIINNDGVQSGQVDCMIVQGEGQPLPFTDKFLYKDEQVVAVIEVKKNLYKKDLIDAYHNLNTVYKIVDPKRLEISAMRDAYRSIIGEDLPTKEELESLPYFKQMIYHNLMIDLSMPLRIVLGYEGFKTEEGLRTAFSEFIYGTIEDAENNKGFGPANFPSLIICRHNALVKVNGLPYTHRLFDDKWLVYCSYNTRPLFLFLEMLWSRLNYNFHITPEIFGEDLTTEALRPFLFGKCVQQGGISGWEYYNYELRQNEIEKYPTSLEWQPSFLNEMQYQIVAGLGQGLDASLDDDSFISFIGNYGYHNKQKFVEEMLETGLIYVDNSNSLQLLTDECAIVILPDGRIAAGENKSGRLWNWFQKHEANKE